MKNLKALMIFMIVFLMSTGAGYVYARGGGHMGGGGFRGGEGHGEEFRGGEGERSGEFRGEGERGEGERGEGGEGKHEDNGQHGKHNNNTVNVYGGGWGWGWGAGDALAGVAVGEAIGEASQPTVIVEQEQTPTQQQPPVQQQMVAGAPAYGARVKSLPAGAKSKDVNGVMAYVANSVWYRPYFGPDGVDYMVVSPPPADSE